MKFVSLLSVGLLAVAAASAALAQPAAPAAPAATPAPAPVPAPAAFGGCAICHETSAGARPSLGPNLFNVGGRKAGSEAGYDYSPAMKSSTVVWSAETLTAFVQDVEKVVPGTRMDYEGADAETAKAIADYLMSLKG